MDVKSKYIQHLRSVYPSLNGKDLENLISDNLLSPFTLDLPAHTLVDIKEAIKACSDLRENPDYQKALEPLLTAHGYKPHPHRSIMMSYDFHIDENGGIKLIEVNTNASFLILGSHFYRTVGLSPAGNSDPLGDLKKSMQAELSAINIKTDHPKVAIVDEKPAEQRLFIEFLVANALFESWGWSSEIQDSREVNPADFNFIYNRDTDFFLVKPELQKLREAAKISSAVVSPHPVEYFYLADKDRMIDWSMDEFRKKIPNFAWEKIDKFLLKSSIMTNENKADLWTARKKLFFKPAHAFGAKSSFRGATISRGTYEGMPVGETLAQEYCPAPEKIFSHEGSEIKMKYDLRCYAYLDQLQMVVARLYQGQVTNLRTPLGGFTCVKFH